MPMGSFDGAEVCELVGLYLLHLLQETGVDLGLYKDDLLGVTRLRGRSLEKMRQRITAIFQENGIKVIGTVGPEATDFFDIFLDLRAGTYRSFVKEGHLPIYVHNQSNQNIGLGVNKRLSMLNSSEELFKQAMPVYQKALLRSKHNHQLKYNKDEVEGRPTRRRRTRNIYWNPPFSMNVKTNIGGEVPCLDLPLLPQGQRHGQGVQQKQLEAKL